MVILEHRSVTDPVKPDSVDFFPSAASENLAFPLPDENFNFNRPVCGFPGATFTYPAYNICVCLKKAKQRPDRKGQPGIKFADTMIFFRKPTKNIDATGSVAEGCLRLLKCVLQSVNDGLRAIAPQVFFGNNRNNYPKTLTVAVFVLRNFKFPFLDRISSTCCCI